MSAEDKTRLVADLLPPGRDGEAGDDGDKTVVVGGGITASNDATVVVMPGDLPAADSGQPTLTMGDSKVINNRFELLDILGSGGMGVVFKARDRRKVEADDSDPFVAIKLLNDDFKVHPDSVISLQREARRSQRLAHPNIVNVHDFDRDDDQVFMTMEFLQGQPLDVLLKEHGARPLDRPAAMSILKDICAAMIHAHNNHIAHSDFKPGNIFVTEAGEAKVLDFGIARAVTSGVGRDSAPAPGTEDKFDASSLGALTPAYASFEMLKGELPEISDDVYAVGCVTYELFAGHHPFKKVNAEDAFNKGLKPARIRSLSSRQWKALRRALAFKREDRYASVQDFWDGFDKRISSLWWLAAATVVVAGGAAVYSYDAQQAADFDKEVVEQNTALKVKQDLSREEIGRLIAEPLMSPQWERDVDEEFQRYSGLVPETDAKLKQYRQDIAQLYLDEASRLRDLREYDAAQRMLEQAAIWGTEAARVTAMKDDINTAVRMRDQRLAEELAEQQRQQQIAQELERQRLEGERNRLAAEQRQFKHEQEEARYQAAQDLVDESLSCQSGFNFAELQQRLKALEALGSKRYQGKLPGFADAVGACVNKIARLNPAAGERLKSVALAAFPGTEAIANIVIDPCVSVKVGGGRKSSASCYDRLVDGGRGPKLVVVPGVEGGQAYAIGKYELSSKELSDFCSAAGSCPEGVDTSSALPARNIPRAQVEAYAVWLSQQSGFKYRLPSYAEWFSAAKAKGGTEDPNRNCTVNARGVHKGDELLTVTTGRTNGWGLVNVVGNAQELALEAGSLVAAGGRHTDKLSSCLITSKRPHSGVGDNVTSFRLLRELAR